jgi:hypothetical protein
MRVPEPRAKLESLKAECATHNEVARLLDKDLAKILSISPARFAQLFDRNAQSMEIPPYLIARLVSAFKQIGAHVETDWMYLSRTEFDARREAAGYRLIVDHPRRIFGSQIELDSFLEFLVQIGGPLACAKEMAVEPVRGLLGGGTPRDVYPEKPIFHFDPDEPPKYMERVPLRVDMPFDGRLTVIEADSVNGEWKFWCIDPLLRIEGRKMGQMRWILPYQGQGIPMNPPEGNCVLIGIAVRGEEQWLQVPWKHRPLEGEGARHVATTELHDISGQLKRRHTADYRVGLIEYAVAARR